jgi:tetratricopeptide (TPR) repeat protein
MAMGPAAKPALFFFSRFVPAGPVLQSCREVLLMWRSFFAVVVFLWAVCGTGITQLLPQPKPVRLRIEVSYAGSHEKVRDATVELQDAVGGSSAMDSKLTDQDGRVEFNTWTGSHRIRITSDNSYAYEGEFEIAPVETSHAEYISVRRETHAQGSVVENESAGKATVSVVRLTIPNAARKEFEKGSQAMARKSWAESRKHFQVAVDIYPKYDLAYNGLGIACTEMKDEPAAERAFRKAIALNDKFAGAERNLARLMLYEHNYEEAASLLNRSLSVDAKDAWALTNAAYAELELHRFKEAAEHALQVHELPHKGLANAHVIAAYALGALGRQQEAIVEWKRYLKEDPNGPNVKRAREELHRLTNSPQS